MVNPACLICGVVNLASLHPQKRLCLLHVIANQCLASAEALPSFACHCKTRPCTRSHAATFCMSLRGAGRLHRDVAIRVPAGAQNEKQYLRRIPNHLRICPNRSQLVKYLCGDADCHVASLLAMTCRNMRRVRMATTWCRGKFVTLSAFAKGTAGQLLPPCPRIHYQANQ